MQQLEKWLLPTASVDVTMDVFFNKGWLILQRWEFSQIYPPLPTQEWIILVLWKWGPCKWYETTFTCLASRTAASLEKDTCVNALRHFVSRGQVTHLVSNNGTNFVEADRELKGAFPALNHKQIEGAFLQLGICWSFNSGTGSHLGGVWERMSRIIRLVFSSVHVSRRWMMAYIQCSLKQ